MNKLECLYREKCIRDSLMLASTGGAYLNQKKDSGHLEKMATLFLFVLKTAFAIKTLLIAFYLFCYEAHSFGSNAVNNLSTVLKRAGKPY
jgi:hypothetical protein